MTASALFIHGGWEGHEPEACVRLIAPLIGAAGMNITISDSLAALDDPAALGRYRVIVPCWTMGELSPQREAALREAIRGGTGLAGWHGGMGDAFRTSTDYQFMAGGQFVAHPGDIIDYRVHIVDRAHPITRGLGDFDVRSEQYYMHVDPSNTVLAETVFSGEHASWIAGCRMPVVWARMYGAGRVFYCSIGHGPDDLGIAEAREMIRRGILWAAKVPDDAIAVPPAPA
ncbi:MAG: ThuA domain-containing protein [Planctomycetota bacterium]|nr:ThuA domain-containing protein [Planctomycetota bacterium]